MNLPLKVTEDLDRAKEVLSHQLPNASDAEILAYALKRLLDQMDPLRKSLAKERHNTRSLAKGSIAQLSSQVEKEENFKAPKQQQHAVPSGVAVKVTTGSASNLNRNEKNQTGGVGLGKLLTKLSKARTRYIVLQKSNGRCTYRDPVTGKICGSRYQIQSDHIIPRALGGTDHPSNLRALCRGHNLLVAEQKLGKRLMDQYRRST